MSRQVEDNQKFTGVRLPKTVKPVHYDLTLEPDLKKFTFSGKVQIQYVSQQPSSSIVLHACELKIADGFIGNNPLKTVTYSKDSETATLEFQDTITPEGSLSLDFAGELNDKMKGFYRTAFKLNDQFIHAATTQFEATDARKCFPCWDEPAFKATFSVTMISPKWITAGDKKYECVALSNMPEVSRSDVNDSTTDDAQIQVKFAKSPIMSTYLLALIVGPFEMIEGTDSRRPIRVYTTPGKTEQGRFALEVACKTLPYYEDYFKIEYPLPKMDMIAIPDFTHGAMENWGLVTYRETCLLVDPENSSLATKQNVALVVAHELAHQWFGNLVTMEWWTHLWLNEGFANFMEYLAVDNLFPEYDIWLQFVTDAYNQALDLDSLHNSHPIEVPVQHPSEIDEIFDTISYCKGSAVIRMLHNYIGGDSFRNGLHNYLKNFAYKNASTEDLWDFLEEASNKPVRKLMQKWTAEKGYPWLSVSQTVEGDSVKLTVTQSTFSANGSLIEDEANKLWMVPIFATTAKDPTVTREVCLLDDRSKQFVVEGLGNNWIKLNSGSIGLYRTAYPDELAKRLLPAISDKTLPPMDRLEVQDDYSALCRAGLIGTVNLLELLLAFKEETVYTVWESIDSCISRLDTILANTDYQEKFHKYGCDLYANIFKRMTWSPIPGEHQNDAILRSLVINRLVSFGHQEVIAEAKRRFEAHVSKKEIISADLRAACYRAASKYGSDADYENLKVIYRTSELNEEKMRAARALGYNSDLNRLVNAAEFAFSDEVRRQDKPFVIMPIAISNPPYAWKLLQDNKDKLRDMYSGYLLTIFVKFSTKNFASEERAKEVENFFAENEFKACKRTIQQSLETIRLNANWLTRDNAAIKTFLEKIQS